MAGANFQLYITELMGVYGRSDLVASGEKSAVMSIGFCFLSSKSEETLHTYPHRQEKRDRAVGGLFKSFCGKPQERLSFYLKYT